MRSLIPFRYVGGGHLISVPVIVNEFLPVRFMFDTGIGLNILFRAFSEEIECVATGERYIGKRMSGQEVSCEITHIPSITMQNWIRKDVTGGILDMTLPADLHEIKGILSLGFFEDRFFTLSYASGDLILEDSATFSERLIRGIEVPIYVMREGPRLDSFVELKLPSGRTIKVEIDTGSNNLILNELFMEELGVRKDEGEKIIGTDETGRSFTRYVARVSGSIALEASDKLSQESPMVVFQKIIHDGLIGVDFFKKFVATFDVRGSRIIFERPRMQGT